MSDRIMQLAEVLAAELPAVIRERDVPGLAIGICDAEQTLWAAGIGTTRRDGGTPIETSTRFSVQSTSKLICASVVLRAVQAGLVDLDAPITQAIPELTVGSVFDAAPQELITLRHCLSHTAGFTHEAPDGSNYDVGSGDFDAHCRSIFDTWLRFPVGHHHEYSNLGIDVAGYAVQRASGAPFAEYARQVLFDPLAMGRSTFDPAVVLGDDARAVGHWRRIDAAGVPLPVPVPMVAAGGLYTSLDDALRYVRFQLNHGEPLLDEQLMREQFRIPFAPAEQRLGYGLGVYLDEWAPGIRVLHHGGSGFGFQCQLCWAPELGLGVVILTNTFDTSLHNELARRIVDELGGDRRSAEPVQAVPEDGSEAGSASADELIGEYVGRLDATGLRVQRAADGLELVQNGGIPQPARVLKPRLIALAGAAHEQFRFTAATAGSSGEVRYMTAVRTGDTRYRNDAATTPRSVLDPHAAGAYEVRVWGVPAGRLRLEQRGDSPVIVTLGDAYGGDGDDPSGELALRLAPVAPGLYISSTGEMLDLRGAAPTYANITLNRIAS